MNFLCSGKSREGVIIASVFCLSINQSVCLSVCLSCLRAKESLQEHLLAHDSLQGLTRTYKCLRELKRAYKSLQKLKRAQEIKREQESACYNSLFNIHNLDNHDEMFTPQSRGQDLALDSSGGSYKGAHQCNLSSSTNSGMLGPL